MKKLLIAFIALLILCVTLTGCATNVDTEPNFNEGTSMFVIIEETESWRVVYHKDTKVMYSVSYGHKNSGNFTVLVNADGSPMLWEG